MAIAMAISVPLSVALTLALMACVFGTDLDAVITVSLGYKFGICMAILGPVALGPLASYRTHLAIRQRDRAQIELRRMAETDQLTALLNRRGIDTALNDVFIDADVNQPLSVLMFDVDFFKSVNDRFGHDFGDAALVQVASVLRDLMQSHHSIFGRQGGEEFIVVLPGLDATAAVAIAEQLRAAIARSPIALAGNISAVTVSIGVASRRPETRSLSELVGEADAALYSAKAAGRDRVVLHQPAVALPIVDGAPISPDEICGTSEPFQRVSPPAKRRGVSGRVSPTR
jgi:diguanylate cyclase (GGDEF)-like protein